LICGLSCAYNHSMNLTEYRSIFSEFSKTQVREVDSEINLTGQNVLVANIDGIWDVWVCSAKKFVNGDRAATLGTRKQNNIAQTLPESTKVNRLDGEFWFQTSNLPWLKKWLFENRKALGLHKRRPAPKVSIQDRVKNEY